MERWLNVFLPTQLVSLLGIRLPITPHQGHQDLSRAIGQDPPLRAGMGRMGWWQSSRCHLPALRGRGGGDSEGAKLKEKESRAGTQQEKVNRCHFVLEISAFVLVFGKVCRNI